MKKISRELSKKGWTLRTGGARGADRAFMEGADQQKVYPPDRRKYPDKKWSEAYKIAGEHHPVWHNLSEQTKVYLVRNSFQVLGDDLSEPSQFLICWTPDGATNQEERSKETGGTGQTIAVASDYNIPIFNLRRYTHRNYIENKILKKDYQVKK